MNDPKANGPGGCRSTDPSTSKKGALDVYPRSGSQRWVILQAIIASGERGLTWGEVAEQTGLTSPWKRISELKQGDFIEPIEGVTRHINQSGSEGQVYVAVGVGAGESAHPSSTSLGGMAGPEKTPSADSSGTLFEIEKPKPKPRYIDVWDDAA